MNHLRASSHQFIGEHEAVASPGHGLRAHYGHRSGQFQQLMNGGEELARGHVIGVSAELLVPPGGVQRTGRGFSTSSQLREMNVGDAERGELFGQ